MTPERKEEIRERAECPPVSILALALGDYYFEDVPDLLAALESSESARLKAEKERDAARKSLRTVQNAAKTLAHSRDSELQHLRENGAYDHKLRAEHDSLIKRDAMMTDRITALEAERDALKVDRDSIIRGAMLLDQKLKAELSDAVAKVAKYEMEAFKEMQHQAEAAKLRKSIPILPAAHWRPAMTDTPPELAMEKAAPDWMLNLIQQYPLGTQLVSPIDDLDGEVVGYYRTREGKLGMALQQNGKRIVDVYQTKWFDGSAAIRKGE